MLLCIIAWFSITWFASLWRSLCTYLQQHFLSGIHRSKWLLKGFHSVATLSSFTIFLASLTELCTAVSLFLSRKCCTPISKGIVQNYFTLCKEWCGFMQGMSYSFKILLHWPRLQGFALTTNFKVLAKTCLLVQRSSLGCPVVLPLVLSNFLRGCSNHESTNKTCTPGRCPWVVAE